MSAKAKEFGSEISVAVLAGGKSTRMGTDKALLEIAGKPMIQWVIESVKEVSDDVMVISNHGEKYGFLNLPTYADLLPSRGPLAGIYTALKHARYERCLITGCDLPFLNADLLKALRHKANTCKVVAVESQSGIEPLCAVYSRSCIVQIEKQFEAKDYKVANFINQMNAATLSCTEAPYAVHNVNTPADLAQAQKHAKQSSRLPLRPAKTDH